MLPSDIKEWLRYEPDTGKFFWLKSNRKPFLIGKEAGVVSTTNGRWYIKFRQKRYARSHLVWEFMMGEIPDGYIIEHVNGDILDDKFANIRLATQSQNLAAKQIPKNLTGYRGVSVHVKSGLFRARVKHRTKYSASVTEAAQFYNEMALEEYGEFAQLNSISRAGYAKLVSGDLEQEKK